jgi:imidazolonepropionase-like amidohydrolase
MTMPIALLTRVPSALLLLSLSAAAQQKPVPLSPFVKQDAPLLVLEHVRLIDGTGAAPREDMRIDIAGGKITAIDEAKSRVAYPPNAKVIDLTGKTVIPGLVGMHEHLFYPSPQRPEGGAYFYGEAIDSAPRLYLAGGVTSARTGGSLETYTDLELKKAIDAGEMPGPKLDVTGPYLEGKGKFALQMHELTDPEDSARLVDYWAAEGVTSFKAYNYLTPEELKAATLGIDNLEHGLAEDTEFYPGKKPGECPPYAKVEAGLENIDVAGPEVQQMIHDLVAHQVAITSTLAILETFAANRPPMEHESAALKTLTLEAAKDYLARRSMVAQQGASNKLLAMEMRFERAFVDAGGLLMAGCDPTGYGGVVPGFGDQRNVELLVEAGFTPVEAIRIASLNGAKFMGKDAVIGSIAVGKAADIVVLGGNPAEKIDNMEKVELVFKDGVGYDPAALIQSVSGLVGLR